MEKKVDVVALLITDPLCASSTTRWNPPFSEPPLYINVTFEQSMQFKTKPFGFIILKKYNSDFLKLILSYNRLRHDGISKILLGKIWTYF